MCVGVHMGLHEKVCFDTWLPSTCWTPASLRRLSETTLTILISLPVCFLSLSLSLFLCLCLLRCLSLICPKLKPRLHSRNLPAYSLLIGLEQGRSTDLVQEGAFEAGWDTYTYTHLLTQAVPLPLPLSML